MVGRVTAQATHIALAMRRSGKIHVISAGAVAFQTSRVDLFRRSSLEAEDLRGIPRVVDVASGRSMTRFASLFGRSPMCIQSRFPMRGFIKVVVNILVTSLASFGAGILARRFL